LRRIWDIEVGNTMSLALETFANVLPVQRLSDRHQEALSSVPPEVASAFVRALYREWKNNPFAATQLSELCTRGLSSEFPLSEWIEQVVRMYRWLSERHSTAEFSDVLEYVSCAFEGSSFQPGYNLDWYLTNYGFERATPLS